MPITSTTRPTQSPLPLLWDHLGEDGNQCSVTGAMGGNMFIKIVLHHKTSSGGGGWQPSPNLTPIPRGTLTPNPSKNIQRLSDSEQYLNPDTLVYLIGKVSEAALKIDKGFRFQLSQLLLQSNWVHQFNS